MNQESKDSCKRKSEKIFGDDSPKGFRLVNFNGERKKLQRRESFGLSSEGQSSSDGIKLLYESLILAQDERWRRA